MINNPPPLIPLLAPDERGRIWRRSTRRLFDPAPRRIPELNIFIGLTGQIQYFINGELIVLGRGTLLLARAADAHFLVKEDDDADMIVAAISPSLLMSPPLHPEEYGDSSHIPRRLSEVALDELVSLSDILINTHDADALNIGLGWWLYRMHQHWKQAQHTTTLTAHPAVARALRLMRNDLTLTIAQVADQAGASNTHLGQVFKREVGVTMTAYRTQLRLNAIEAAIRSKPNLSLLNAALDVGFGDYSSFYRAYVGVNGKPPCKLKHPVR
ncbi:helix-turn-helix domain-containing protein [Colwellia sp. RE-S-Sl-9]